MTPHATAPAALPSPRPRFLLARCGLFSGAHAQGDDSARRRPANNIYVTTRLLRLLKHQRARPAAPAAQVSTTHLRVHSSAIVKSPETWRAMTRSDPVTPHQPLAALYSKSRVRRAARATRSRPHPAWFSIHAPKASLAAAATWCERLGLCAFVAAPWPPKDFSRRLCLCRGHTSDAQQRSAWMYAPTATAAQGLLCMQNTSAEDIVATG